MKRGAQLPAQSKKRKAVAAGRVKFVADFLGKNPRCQVRWDRSCTGTAVHVHEPLLRSRGGSILDVANAVATCWWCHAQLHAHPEEATARGFMRSQHSRGPSPSVVIVDDPPPDTQAFIREQAARWLPS